MKAMFVEFVFILLLVLLTLHPVEQSSLQDDPPIVKDRIVLESDPNLVDQLFDERKSSWKLINESEPVEESVSCSGYLKGGLETLRTWDCSPNQGSPVSWITGHFLGTITCELVVTDCRECEDLGVKTTGVNYYNNIDLVLNTTDHLQHIPDHIVDPSNSNNSNYTTIELIQSWSNHSGWDCRTFCKPGSLSGSYPEIWGNSCNPPFVKD